MKGVYLATKTKNALYSYNRNYVINLKNISINGAKHGCSGFVQNPSTGLTVYVTTEDNYFMCRYARDMNDYVGGINRWADTFEELIMKVACLLKKEMPDPLCPIV